MCSISEKHIIKVLKEKSNIANEVKFYTVRVNWNLLTEVRFRSRVKLFDPLIVVNHWKKNVEVIKRAHSIIHLAFFLIIGSESLHLFDIDDNGKSKSWIRFVDLLKRGSLQFIPKRSGGESEFNRFTATNMSDLLGSKYSLASSNIQKIIMVNCQMPTNKHSWKAWFLRGYTFSYL